TYTGTGGAGLDTIHVCVTHVPQEGEPAEDCHDVSKTWVAPTATPTFTPTATRTPTVTPTGTPPPTSTPTSTPTTIPATSTIVPPTRLPPVVQRQLGGALAGVVEAAGASERQRNQLPAATSVAVVAGAPSVIISAPNTGDAGISHKGHSSLPWIGAGFLVFV